MGNTQKAEVSHGKDVQLHHSQQEGYHCRVWGRQLQQQWPHCLTAPQIAQLMLRV